MTTIDYAKYENMDREQLAVILAKTQTKEKKIKADLDNAKNLIRFLKERVKEPKDEFIPLKECESYKNFQKSYSKMNNSEKEKLKAEVWGLVNKEYDGL